MGVVSIGSKVVERHGKKVAQARLAPHECSNALAHTTRMRPDLNRDCATLLLIETTPPAMAP